MNSFCYKTNFISIANRTSCSFYSTSSFNRNSTRVTSLSSQNNFYRPHRKKIDEHFHRGLLREKLLKNEAYLLKEKNANKDIFITHKSIDELKKEDFRTITPKRKLPRIFVPIFTEEYKLFNYKTPRNETLSSKFHEINTNPKVTQEISKIRLKLDTEKKIMKSRIKIKEEKKRRESLNVNILKKYNKVLYKPNKKLGITIYNITFGKKDQKEKKMNNKEINNANAMDILTY